MALVVAITPVVSAHRSSALVALVAEATLSLLPAVVLRAGNGVGVGFGVAGALTGMGVVGATGCWKLWAWCSSW